MGFFNSSATKTQQSTGSQTGTNTPTEAQNVTDFRNSLYPQINSLIASAGKPIYGQAQEAQFNNNLNRTTNSNLNSLASQLASRTGSVNSGAYATGIQNLLNQRQQAQSGYSMQVPYLNQQAQLQNLGSTLGLATGFAGRAPVGNISSGTSQSNGTTTETQRPSIFSDILGVGGAALGAASGLQGLGLFNGNNPLANKANQTGFNNNLIQNSSNQLTGVGGFGLGDMSDLGYGANGMPVGGGFNDIPSYF